MSAISFVPFNDVLKLIKRSSRLRIGFGENNNCDATEIENRVLDVRWVDCIPVVKESGESNSRQGRI